jgi:large subunit ribosomal protein L20
VPRVKRGSKRRERRKKFLSITKGQFQNKSKLYRYAKEAAERSLKFAYIGRRLKKRDFRSLWIIRIAAAARQNGISYSKLIHGMSLAGIDINRKMLAEMAVRDAEGFARLVEQVRPHVGGASADSAPAAPAPAAPAPAAPAPAVPTPTEAAPAEAAPEATAPAEAPAAEEPGA